MTHLSVNDPMAYCNDFRGLLLADYKEALKNIYPEDEVNAMRESTTQILSDQQTLRQTKTAHDV